MKIRKLSVNRHWLFFFSCLLVVVLIPLIVSQLRNAKKSEAAWFDGNWLYRKAIDITNNTSAENNVYTSHTIDTSDTTRFQADCGDLRFTHQTGKILKYYVASGCGTGTTVIHVLHDTLAAGRQTIYMYYGNAAAENGFEAADFAAEASNYSISATGSEQTTPGPVAYWKFDEGQGQTVNDQAKKNNGTLGANSSSASDDPTWKQDSDCVSGKCLFFDGSNDFTKIGEVSLNGKSSFSISTWVKLNQTGVNQRIVGKDEINTDYPEYGLTINSSNKAGLWFATANSVGGWGTPVYGNTSLEANKWYHIEGTYDGSNIRVYINGVLDLTTPRTGTPYDNNDETYIGAAKDSLTTTSALTKGVIDEVKIFEYTRSAAQVKTDALSGSQGAAVQMGATDQKWLTNGLVGYWKMDESAANGCTGGSNDSCDSSGSSNDGAWTGNVAVTTGKFGSGTSFDGSGDYITTPSLSTQTAGTYSMWVKPTSINATYGFFDTPTGYDIFLDNTSLYFRPGTGQASVIPTWTAGTWNHIAMTWDTTTWRGFVNGALVASGSNVGGSSFTGVVTLGYVDANSVHYFNGTMDETRIYNRMLSPDEIRQLYNWAPGPVGYWNFDEGSGQSPVDLSGNAYATTLGTNSSVGTDDPSWTDGKYGKAVSFDGTNKFVKVGDTTSFKWLHGALDTSNFKFTFSSWIKLNGATHNYETLFSTSSYDGNSVGTFFLVQSDGSLGAYIVNGPGGGGDPLGHGVSSGTFPSDQKWHFVTWSYDQSLSSNNSLIYIDGKLVSSATKTGGATPSTSNSEHALYFGNINAVSTIGKQDEVRIYNYVRTPQQIIEDMNGGHPAGSQTVKYNFDEQQGSVANNSNSANSSITGSISGATWKTKENCKINGCLDFDGSDDVVTTTNTSAIDLNENLASGFTWSGWIYPDTAGEGSGGQVFFKGTNTWVRVDSLSGGKLDLEASLDLATTDATVNVATAITQSAWNHVALSYTDDADDEITIWVNGNPVGTSTNGVGSPAADTGNFLIGGTTTANFDGKIDQVNIYNSELSKEGIGIDMNNGSSISYSVLGQSEAANLTSGAGNAPTAEWKLDENGGQSLKDTGGGGFAGTLGTDSSVGSDDPTWQSAGKCKYGSCLSFDGSNDYVVITDPGPSSGSFSIETWFNTNNLDTTDKGIIGKNKTSGFAYLELEGSGAPHPSKIRFILRNQAGSDIFDIYSDSVTLSSNTWYHIAGTYDTSSGGKLYINGALVASSNSTGAYDFSSGIFELGRIPGTSARYFPGKIDESKVYNYARTAAQVAYDYNRGKPVGWWKLDECQGATVNDASGNGNNGTISIDATGTQTSIGTCSTSGTAWGNGAIGKFNASLNFDGTDDYATLTTSAPYQFDTNDFSIGAWVKTTSIGAAQTILDGRDSASDGVYFHLASTNALRTIVNGTGTITTTIIPTNTWTHVMVTRTSGTLRWYVNGVLDVTTVSASGAVSTTTPPRIGGRSFTSPTAPFNGQIDDLRVYNYALSATQVNQLLNEGSAVRFGN